jgi:glycosyltransferase involved in cell wall biosynthesis
MKEKMLYFMHIDWNWIKQRPHFLAEELSSYYDITVYYLKGFKKNLFQKGEKPNYVSCIYRFPFLNNKISRKLNQHLIKIQLKNKIEKFKYIWLTNPILFGLVKNLIPQEAVLIYDCMDDYLEFLEIKKSRDKFNNIYYLEMCLIKRSDYIFASSTNLKNKLETRYGNLNNKCYIINNAVKIPKFYINKIDLYKKYNIDKNMKIATYIGTISEWFDFDLIMRSIELNQNITYLFVGPKDRNFPKHERIIYEGPVNHEEALRIMCSSDCLIMPFKVNDLILSVDPVKIYEYIYSCVPSIVVRYNETLKFEDFVYLYSSLNEYIHYINLLTNDKLPLKQDKSLYIQYAEQNTWKNRAEEILSILNGS